MEPPAESTPGEASALEHRGKWKRKRRSLWRRIFRRSVLVALGAIGAALVLLYFLIHNIGTYKEPD
ncbi:MAG TPA: hypothetical protein VEN81_13985 [Planctomycetota bacterium]|nr:hypothetical protein [Planctomycetota bacterium]